MLIKSIIVILLIGLIISLSSGLIFLFKDVGTSKRTLYALGVRICLASLLMATTVYGFMSGQIQIGAPWDARKFNNVQQSDIVTPPSTTPPITNE